MGPDKSEAETHSTGYSDKCTAAMGGKADWLQGILNQAN